MATRTVSIEELADAILGLLDYSESIDISISLDYPNSGISVNDIEAKLIEKHQVFSSAGEIADALNHLISEKKIELTSFYIIVTSSSPIISCFVRKSLKQTKVRYTDSV